MADDTFLMSYLNYRKKVLEEDHLERFIEEIVRKGTLAPTVGLEKNVANALDRSVSILLTKFYHYLIPNLHECVFKTESPIEQLLVLALVITGINNGTNIDTKFFSRHTGKDQSFDIIRYGDNSDVLIINNQTEIGDYRVDFLLELESDIPDFANTVKLADGKEMPGTMRGSAQLIVECDGHDFHEKTKEQAKKDKSRDRVLQSVGYTVFHFTGSEIYRDCFKCAMQCYDYLHDKVWGNN